MLRTKTGKHTHTKESQNRYLTISSPRLRELDLSAEQCSSSNKILTVRAKNERAKNQAVRGVVLTHTKA